MSRFTNLELGSEEENESQGQEFVRDEASHLAEAQSAFEKGEFEQALRSYAKVLGYNPQNAAAWTGQVRMLIELGEFHEAKLWADKALERFPHEPELLAAKGVVLGRMGDLGAALAFSDAAIEERGDTSYVWLARGDVLLARKERRASFCFEKALALAPRHWFFRWLASRIYYFYKKFAVALKWAQEALTLDASQAAVWLQMGLCQQALGLATHAKNAIEQAYQLNPHCQAAARALTELPSIGLWSRLCGWWQERFSP
jgi:tetratricopeptide (TPR) repeat protein